jgi:catechol 2,3-dioxygenase
MADIRHAEHAVVRTPDIEKAVEFYTEVIGMQQLREENGVIYLGCGIDDRFDIAFKRGPLGMDHIAMRVDSLDQIEKRFREAKIQYKRTATSELGSSEVIEFTLPTGLKVEAIAESGSDYFRPSRGVSKERTPSAPLDLDHLTMLAKGPKDQSDFLQAALGLKVSEARDNGDGTWRSVFMRYGYHHHDFAFLSTKNESQLLHHIAMTYSSVGHMVLAMDKIARSGLQVESGPYRHVIGSNISTYYVTPAGNRLELATEVATVSPSTPPKIWPPGPEPATSAWGPIVYTEASRTGI